MKSRSSAQPGDHAEGGFYLAEPPVLADRCWSAPPRVPAKHAQRFEWRMRRALRGIIDDGTCGMLPAYTGGVGRPVMVDGKPRSPACFGSRGEPWAFPLGAGRACNPEFDLVIVVIDTRRGHPVFVELFA